MDSRSRPDLGSGRRSFLKGSALATGAFYINARFPLGMLRGEINGEDVHPLTIWHFGDRITESEYHTLMRVAHEPKPF